MVSTEWAATGRKLTDVLMDHGDDIKLLETLQAVYLGSVRVKANLSRELAGHFAMAASLGLITTRIPGKGFGTVWLITGMGLLFLEEAHAIT